jgi:virulence factor Mce-like protein
MTSRRRRVIYGFSSLAVLVVIVLFAFVIGLPFQKHFRFSGIFQSSTQLRKGNPVRIAGIDIGTVDSVAPVAGGRARVTFSIDPDYGDDLHSDATLDIEPRLFFEGNFYVQVHPGSPASPPMPENATVPLPRTTVPVQLDQVLDVLDRPTRSSLTTTTHAIGGALNSGGSDGLRRAVRELNGALGDIEGAARGVQGTQPGDLHNAIDSSSDLTSQLARDPAALAGLVTHYNDVFTVLARRHGELAASMRNADAVLRRAPRALEAIDRAVPEVEDFARDLRPALNELPSALRPTTALLSEISGLTSPGELPAALDDLRPITQALPAVQRRLEDVLPRVTDVTRCVSRNVVPTLDTKIQDGPNSTNRPVWQDFIHSATALAGASPNFDGNGTTIRLGVTESEQALAGAIPGLGEVIGGGQIEGVRPTWLGYGVDPPFRPDATCTKQALPDLTKRAGGPPTGFRSVKAQGLSGLDRRLLPLLFGSRADHHTLLRELVDLLPSTDRHRTAPARRRPHRPAPVSPAPAPAQTPKPVVAPGLTTPLDSVLKSVQPLLDQTKQTVDKTLPPSIGDSLKSLLGGTR